MGSAPAAVIAVVLGLCVANACEAGSDLSRDMERLREAMDIQADRIDYAESERRFVASGSVRIALGAIYGKFDVEYIDLSTTAWWNGIKIVPANASFRHASGQTINKLYPDRERYTFHNMGLWKQKWASRAEELRKKIYGS